MKMRTFNVDHVIFPKTQRAKRLMFKQLKYFRNVVGCLDVGEVAKLAVKALRKVANSLVDRKGGLEVRVVREAVAGFGVLREPRRVGGGVVEDHVDHAQKAALFFKLLDHLGKRVRK